MFQALDAPMVWQPTPLLGPMCLRHALMDLAALMDTHAPTVLRHSDTFAVGLWVEDIQPAEVRLQCIIVTIRT